MATSGHRAGGSRSKRAALVKGRWSLKRFSSAQSSLVELLIALGATESASAVLRRNLREAARRVIGDTGLLDYLLKHLVGRQVTDQGHFLRRRHNGSGQMEYWLQVAGDGFLDPMLVLEDLGFQSHASELAAIKQQMQERGHAEDKPQRRAGGDAGAPPPAAAAPEVRVDTGGDAEEEDVHTSMAFCPGHLEPSPLSRNALQPGGHACSASERDALAQLEAACRMSVPPPDAAAAGSASRHPSAGLAASADGAEAFAPLPLELGSAECAAADPAASAAAASEPSQTASDCAAPAALLLSQGVQADLSGSSSAADAGPGVLPQAVLGSMGMIESLAAAAARLQCQVMELEEQQRAMSHAFLQHARGSG